MVSPCTGVLGSLERVVVFRRWWSKVFNDDNYFLISELFAWANSLV